MPYLPAKDELVSLDRLSSRGLWKWYNSKGFGPATIWRGAAFHFLAVFSKMKILWKLWLWFSKMFHQRVLSDWKWSISKFQFWRRILDFYRQPLLNCYLRSPMPIYIRKKIVKIFKLYQNCRNDVQFNSSLRKKGKKCHFFFSFLVLPTNKYKKKKNENLLPFFKLILVFHFR